MRFEEELVGDGRVLKTANARKEKDNTLIALITTTKGSDRHLYGVCECIPTYG